jgi:hypothetical protein
MAANMTPEEVVRAWNDVYSKQDIDGALKFLSEDFFKLCDHAMWEPMNRELWALEQRPFFPAFPDWQWEMLSLMVSGDTVVCEFVERATFTGTFEVAPGCVFPPTNETYSDHGAIFFRVNEDGLIAEMRTYYTNNLERTFHFLEKIMAYFAENPQASL